MCVCLCNMSQEQAISGKTDQSGRFKCTFGPPFVCVFGDGPL